MPTAVQAPADVQDTLNRPLPCAPAGFGVAWMDHELPSQNSARVTSTPELSTYWPTAVQVPVEVQETPESSLISAPGSLGSFLTDHDLPFHASAKLTSMPELST